MPCRLSATAAAVGILAVSPVSLLSGWLNGERYRVHRKRVCSILYGGELDSWHWFANASTTQRTTTFPSKGADSNRRSAAGGKSPLRTATRPRRSCLLLDEHPARLRAAVLQLPQSDSDVSKLDLTSRAGLMLGGDNGPAIVPATRRGACSTRPSPTSRSLHAVGHGSPVAGSDREHRGLDRGGGGLRRFHCRRRPAGRAPGKGCAALSRTRQPLSRAPV